MVSQWSNELRSADSFVVRPCVHCWMNTWWRHQMETLSALLALCAGNSPVPVKSPHKGQKRGALMFSLICAWKDGWVNNRKAGHLGCHRAHYDVIVIMNVYTVEWTWLKWWSGAADHMIYAQFTCIGAETKRPPYFSDDNFYPFSCIKTV